jgi:hypothetical protein
MKTVLNMLPCSSENSVWRPAGSAAQLQPLFSSSFCDLQTISGLCALSVNCTASSDFLLKQDQIHSVLTFFCMNPRWFVLRRLFAGDLLERLHDVPQ